MELYWIIGEGFSKYILHLSWSSDLDTHFPSPGDLPHPGIEPGSPTLQTDSLSSEPPRRGVEWKKPTGPQERDL